jgi:hypothetical protein
VQAIISFYHFCSPCNANAPLPAGTPHRNPPPTHLLFDIIDHIFVLPIIPSLPSRPRGILLPRSRITILHHTKSQTHFNRISCVASPYQPAAKRSQKVASSFDLQVSRFHTLFVRHTVTSHLVLHQHSISSSNSRYSPESTMGSSLESSRPIMATSVSVLMPLPFRVPLPQPHLLTPQQLCQFLSPN